MCTYRRQTGTDSPGASSMLCAVCCGGCQLGPSSCRLCLRSMCPCCCRATSCTAAVLLPPASCGGELCVTVSGFKCHNVSLIRQHPHQGVCVRSVRCVSQVPGCTTCSPHHAVRTRPQAGLLLSVTLSHSVRHMASQRQWVAWANPFVV